MGKEIVRKSVDYSFKELKLKELYAETQKKISNLLNF